MDCLYCALRALSVACSPVLQLCPAAPAAPGTTLLYHALAGTILAVNHPATHALPAPCTVPCLSPCVPCAACSTGMALLHVPPCIRCLHNHCLHQALPAAPCSTAPCAACTIHCLQWHADLCTMPPFPCHALLCPAFALCSLHLGAQPSCSAGDVLQGAGILGCRGVLAQAWAARKTPSLHLDSQIKNHDLQALGVKSFTFFLKSWYLSENTGYQPSCALCWHWWPGWVLLKHC